MIMINERIKMSSLLVGIFLSVLASGAFPLRESDRGPLYILGSLDGLVLEFFPICQLATDSPD